MKLRLCGSVAHRSASTLTHSRSALSSQIQQFQQDLERIDAFQLQDHRWQATRAEYLALSQALLKTVNQWQVASHRHEKQLVWQGISRQNAEIVSFFNQNVAPYAPPRSA
jgi:thermostable 8-oxoguanine DNA glycosylase